MKLTKTHKQRIKDALVTTLFLSQLAIVGCGGGDNWAPTSHIAFVDYTTSCNTMDEFNREYVKKRIMSIAEKLQNKDELVVYPIHAYTESASPIIDPIRLPILKGDLVDSKRKKEWKKSLGSEIDKVLNYQFSAQVLAGTNVFAAIRKVNRSIKNNTKVQLHFISDMVHEMNDISFKTVFPDIEKLEMHTLAVEMAKKYCPSQSLVDINVTIYLPGRPSGGDMEPLYYTVNCFWEEFFSNAGTSVKIRELKA